MRKMFEYKWRSIKLEEHILNCTEQEICNMSYMNLNQKLKFNVYCMKKDTAM